MDPLCAAGLIGGTNGIAAVPLAYEDDPCIPALDWVAGPVGTFGGGAVDDGADAEAG